jgi:hypothetical protein
MNGAEMFMARYKALSRFAGEGRVRVTRAARCTLP